MKPEEQRIAIAEACGAKWMRWGNHPDAPIFLVPRDFPPAGSFVPSVRKPSEAFRSDGIPNYLTDLNAMHEAENVLTDEQFEQYEVLLANVAGNVDSLGSRRRQRCKVSATAAQRAEAFLRTIGKWKDEELKK